MNQMMNNNNNNSSNSLVFGKNKYNKSKWGHQSNSECYYLNIALAQKIMTSLTSQSGNQTQDNKFCGKLVFQSTATGQFKQAPA